MAETNNLILPVYISHRTKVTDRYLCLKENIVIIFTMKDYLLFQNENSTPRTHKESKIIFRHLFCSAVLRIKLWDQAHTISHAFNIFRWKYIFKYSVVFVYNLILNNVSGGCAKERQCFMKFAVDQRFFTAKIILALSALLAVFRGSIWWTHSIEQNPW